MQRNRLQKLAWWAVLLFCLTLLQAPSALGARQLVVIVHNSSPVAQLSATEAKAYYIKRQQQWTDGSKVRPVQQLGEARDAFLKKVLGMSNTEFERYWLERKYAAAESPPKQVDSDEDVIRFVAAMKGAIGFVQGTSLDESSKSKVKAVLKVEY